jgi:predicted nucleic acid-binding protein
MVDTSVWSLAFRRDGEQRAPQVAALRAALDGADSIVITGIILQELLQGFTGPSCGNGRPVSSHGADTASNHRSKATLTAVVQRDLGPCPANTFRLQGQPVVERRRGVRASSPARTP